MDNVLSPFTDIPYQPLPMFTNPPSNVSGTEEFQIGFGSRVLRGDSQGLWLGAKKFIDAPFSVNMEGDISLRGSTSSFIWYADDGLPSIVIANL